MDNSPRHTLRLDSDSLAEIAAEKAVLLPMLHVASSIQGIRDTGPLLDRLLNEIRECIPAPRIALLQPDLQPVVQAPSAFQIAGEIAADAQRERIAIMVKGTPTVLCAPLRSNDFDHGAIYLEYDAPEEMVERDFRVLAAIAPVVASELDHAHYVAKLRGQKSHLERWAYVDHTIIGKSPAIQKLKGLIAAFADSNARVLIIGESGTGKELVARAIHANSSRRSGPFIPINCGAIQPELMENELFGHERGAFTGAVGSMEGLVDLANGGTLFLDEIGELPLQAQAALLRLIQEGEYRRVGGRRLLHADVRIVAATNRDLKDLVKQGKFREDLYYRLNVAMIRTPSLSEMREDIPELVQVFFAKFHDLKPVAGISDETMKALVAFSCPGNVRQLQNAVEAGVLMCPRGEIIQPEHLPSYVWETETSNIPAGNYYESMHQHQRTIIERALIEAGGNYTKAAEILGISERYLRTLAHTHGLDR